MITKQQLKFEIKKKISICDNENEFFEFNKKFVD
jgi:hypothetical protein